MSSNLPVHPAPPEPPPANHDLPLHPQANNDVNLIAAEYAAGVTQLAQTLAKLDGANETQSGHVLRAKALLVGGGANSRSKEYMIALGGVFFGAFVQGFIEAVGNGNKWRTIVYVLLGFLGFALIVLGINKR